MKCKLNTLRIIHHIDSCTVGPTISIVSTETSACVCRDFYSKNVNASLFLKWIVIFKLKDLDEGLRAKQTYENITWWQIFKRC